MFNQRSAPGGAHSSHMVLCPRICHARPVKRTISTAMLMSGSRRGSGSPLKVGVRVGSLVEVVLGRVVEMISLGIATVSPAQSISTALHFHA